MLTKSLGAFALTAAFATVLCGSASAEALLVKHVPAAVAALAGVIQ